MRWLLVLGTLAACDRVFGLGDPFEDAATTGSGDAATDGAPDGSGRTLQPLLADFELDGNFTDSVSGSDATCTRSSGSLCGFSQGHDGSHSSALFDGGTCVAFALDKSPSALSIALWLKPANGSTKTVLVRPYGSSTDPSWLVQEDINALSFESYNGSLSFGASASPGIPDSGWHLLVVTIDPTSSAFYVDGAVRPGSDGVPIGYGGNMTIYIGCDILTTSFDNFDGQLDNVKIFEGVLTSQDVMQLAL